MEEVKLIPIADLLRRRRPLSGTSLFTFQTHFMAHSTSGDPKTQNPNPNTKVLKPLSEPSVIVGTLSLPTFHTLSCHRCFSFSDSSGSVCCDVVDFDVRMIGKKVHVVSWNFIPFNKMCGGLLEIINWEFAEGSNSVVSVDSFPLFSGDVSEDCSKARHCICGVLESVSPVLVVPGTANSGGMKVHGFIAEVLSCDCEVCKVKEYTMYGLVMEGRDRHDFSGKKFVYFTGAMSFWHPTILRLVGNLVSLMGLTKKEVYLGKEEARIMLVTTEVTCLNYKKWKRNNNSHSYGKKDIEGNGEIGMYIGVVRGVYMQSMVVELDEEVWLLLTDQLLNVPHSLRVGAVLCLRNVHIVNPKLPWSKMLILGACYKTNISVVSFSPLENGCQLPVLSQSHLGKFIRLLLFPARLWSLLVVQCFRKKFSGTFSEKKILGSKEKEGLVETYARSRLPLSFFRSVNSMFVEFCKHDCCSACANANVGSLRLAVPFSNFVNSFDRMWVKSLLQMENGPKMFEACNQVDHFSKEDILSDQLIRTIVPSKDTGFSLLGNLKISPVTGTLQYIDATGSIDAVIPDLPSAWDMDAIYEVTEYSLVLEGRPEGKGKAWILDNKLLSCTDIFGSVQLEKQTELVAYVHFAWRNVISRDFSVHHCLISSSLPEPGSFHLLHLTHKFPSQAQCHGERITSARCSSFAEATILPWDLYIGTIDGLALPVGIQQHKLDNKFPSDSSFKRCKYNDSSVCSKRVGLYTNSNHGNPSCNHSSSVITLPHKRSADYVTRVSPVQIPCAVFVQRMHGERVALSGILFSQDDRNNDVLSLTSPKKVLLEFDSKNVFKYKILYIGGYYIMKHSAEKCFCGSMNKSSGSKIVINLDTHLWSLSFHFGEIESPSMLSDQSLGSYPISERSCRDYLHNELLLHPCSTAGYGMSSDISVHVTTGAVGLLDVDHQEEMVKLFPRFKDVCSICQSVGSRSSLVRVFQGQRPQSSNCLPQGDLVSIRGTVVTLLSGCCSLDGMRCDGSEHDGHQLIFAQGGGNLIFLQVLTDGQMVEISGCLHKRNYPVGLGQGADVTFHRILALGEPGRLLLIPVSFITVNFIKEVSVAAASSFCCVKKESVTLCLVSDLTLCDVRKPSRFRCRIVAVHIVMLEKNRDLDKLQSDMRSKKVFTSIQLAAFIVDDGSSQCCCWANGERAATFLKLHEDMPRVGYGGCWCGLAAVGSHKCCSTPSSYLSKILKKGSSLTVKNYGSVYETSYQDLELSIGSEIICSSQDEDVLRFMILNACSSTYWSVRGHVMDSKAINELEKYLMEEQMDIPFMKNVWVGEVSPVDTLAEARSLYRNF